MLTCLSQL